MKLSGPNSPLRILYLTDSFPSRRDSVQGIFNRRRAEALVRKGVYVETVRTNKVLSRTRGLCFGLGYSTPACRVRVVNWLNRSGAQESPALVRALHRIFTAGRFDLVHVHSLFYSLPAIRMKQRYGIPYVVTAIDSDVLSRPQEDSHFGEIA